MRSKNCNQLVRLSLGLIKPSKKSGVSRSSVYHLFGSRAGLIARVEAQAALADISDGVKLFYAIALKLETRDQLQSQVP